MNIQCNMLFMAAVLTMGLALQAMETPPQCMRLPRDPENILVPVGPLTDEEQQQQGLTMSQQAALVGGALLAPTLFVLGKKTTSNQQKGQGTATQQQTTSASVLGLSKQQEPRTLGADSGISDGQATSINTTRATPATPIDRYTRWTSPVITPQIPQAASSSGTPDRRAAPQQAAAKNFVQQLGPTAEKIGLIGNISSHVISGGKFLASTLGQYGYSAYSALKHAPIVMANLVCSHPIAASCVAASLILGGIAVYRYGIPLLRVLQQARQLRPGELIEKSFEELSPAEKVGYFQRVIIFLRQILSRFDQIVIESNKHHREQLLQSIQAPYQVLRHMLNEAGLAEIVEHDINAPILFLMSSLQEEVIDCDKTHLHRLLLLAAEEQIHTISTAARLIEPSGS